MRHTGSNNHVFTIEQLPCAQGYRIFQSYQDAYSLKAWLSGDTAGLFEVHTGEIMRWGAEQVNIGKKLMQLTGGRASLDNLDAVPSWLSPFRAYLEYMRDYDDAEIMVNFKKAWQLSRQGSPPRQGRVLGDYLPKLARLSTYFSEHGRESIARESSCLCCK